MALVSYEKGYKTAEEMTVFFHDQGFKGLYFDTRVDRRTLYKGYYAYDLRHDNNGDICSMEHDYVTVNNAGSFVTKIQIPDLSQDGSFIEFNKGDWDYTF